MPVLSTRKPIVFVASTRFDQFSNTLMDCLGATGRFIPYLSAGELRPGIAEIVATYLTFDVDVVFVFHLAANEPDEIALAEAVLPAICALRHTGRERLSVILATHGRKFLAPSVRTPPLVQQCNLLSGDPGNILIATIDRILASSQD